MKAIVNNRARITEHKRGKSLSNNRGRITENFGLRVPSGVAINNIPSDAVLYSDGTQVYYSDGTYLAYV